MSRVSAFSSPLFLGFEHFERLFDQASKASDNYPPYNIERFSASPAAPENWRISLAVAGFTRSDLEVTVEDRELVIRGAHRQEGNKDYVHCGIAGRSFAKTFVMADGMEIDGAQLENGLLLLTLVRRAAEKKTLRIDLKE